MLWRKHGQISSRRYGVAVLAALEMESHYPIDPNRVYVAGFSGGARIAGQLGFYQSDVFRATIQSCGADFYTQVPQVYATSLNDVGSRPYGVFAASPDEIQGARQVRFVFITGPGDFRRGNIFDVYYGGFAQDGFQAQLFDIPDMSHQVASGSAFDAALDFIEGSR